MLEIDQTLGLGYTSRTQQVRRVTEDWVARNGYCLRCDCDRLIQTAANTKARDFTCQNCSHGYELKSKLGSFSTRVLDGAYGSMLATIRESRTPTFLLLEYSIAGRVERLRAIHHSLITESAIQPRKPLAVTARRAGWIGCNIILSDIALQGQIPLLESGRMTPRTSTRSAFASLERLATLSPERRTWAATALLLTERLPPRFSLQDIYQFEAELQLLFPNNRHVRPKIRQQLQVLRDVGLLIFLGGGRYERAIRM
jgi:type II restriction enzyme